MKNINYNPHIYEISSEIVKKCTGCKICMKECIMLNDYTECPKDLFEKFLIDKYIDPVIPFSCNLCKMCTTVCPEKLDLPGVFMSMRETITRANGGKTPFRGHTAVYIHQLLGSGLMNIFTIRRKIK